MRYFDTTNPLGTAFAPKQSLYRKETTGMESPKMYCNSRCGNSTYQCGATNYPILLVAVLDREWKYAKLQAYQCHRTAFARKQWLYEKETTGMESSKMYCSSRCRNSTYQCVAANYPVSWGAVYGREWKYSKLWAYQFQWYRFAPKQWLYQKETTGMESSKMYCCTRCRNSTYQCGDENYLVSWGVA